MRNGKPATWNLEPMVCEFGNMRGFYDGKERRGIDGGMLKGTGLRDFFEWDDVFYVVQKDVTPFFGRIESESGVALCLPPHSKLDFYGL